MPPSTITPNTITATAIAATRRASSAGMIGDEAGWL